MYSENCHPLKHNLVSYSDKESNHYFSDSESNAGSGVASVNKNNESSDSSDSEFNMEDVNDEQMSEDDTEKIKDHVISNGVEEDAGSSDKICDDNFSDFPKLDFGNFNNAEELYESGLGSDLFSEIENISYDYLHSNLLLDKE